LRTGSSTARPPIQASMTKPMSGKKSTLLADCAAPYSRPNRARADPADMKSPAAEP